MCASTNGKLLIVRQLQAEHVFDMFEGTNQCVFTQSVPEGEWFCPDCRPKQRSNRLPSRQRSSIDEEEERDYDDEEKEEEESEEEEEEESEEESEEEEEEEVVVK